MSLFKTSPDAHVEIYKIATKMDAQGLSKQFISDAVKLALEYEGAFDLMKLWSAEEDTASKEEIIANLQEEIDDNEDKPLQVLEKPKISYTELGNVAQKIVAFKTALKKKVDARGGITELARKTGMHQSSLSRFFNSAAMPRRITLYKIAKAMDLKEEDIAFDYVV